MFFCQLHFNSTSERFNCELDLPTRRTHKLHERVGSPTLISGEDESTHAQSLFALDLLDLFQLWQPSRCMVYAFAYWRPRSPALVVYQSHFVAAATVAVEVHLYHLQCIVCSRDTRDGKTGQG